MPFQPIDECPELTKAVSAEEDLTRLADALKAYTMHLSDSEAAPLLALLDTHPQAGNDAPVGRAPASETLEQRRARWLDWYGAGERGAVQRVYERELIQNPKADRGFIGKQIKKAKAEQIAKKQGSAVVPQLVRDGKRTG